MFFPFAVWFPPVIGRALADFALRADLPKSAVVVQAVDEWLRMQAHPRITFVGTNTGERRAAMLSGPQVWTVAASWRKHPPVERTADVVAGVLGLPVVDVDAALGYWSAYRDEIDRLIELHEADQDAALRAWERRRAPHAG